ncbi:hypothetical protein F4777DRAFT_563341 [Nemania sp. FL0916]|nr:hypothetical protein F4777DRAFT_563341 [Nemania sp. FL0916]
MLIPFVFLFSSVVQGATLRTRQTSDDDCTTAIQLAGETSSGVIDGQTAQSCLLSLPFNAKRGAAFLTEIKKYIQFQSTLEVLKSPPSTYLSPAVDILGGLDKINNTKYSNQYQFDLDISNLVKSANDGHFSLFPCSLSAFEFFREQVGLVSVSGDGRGQPDIYVGTDLPALSAGSTAVSPVTSINGQDVTQYLDSIAAVQGFQDPDARWNSLFVSLAAVASIGSDPLSLGGKFTSNGGIWPGAPQTRLDFKNGSSLELQTFAKYFGPSSRPISSSLDLWQAQCIPASSSNKLRRGTPTKNAVASPTATAGPRGFPQPFIADPYNQIIGYELDNETAVMFIPTFAGGQGFPLDQDLIFSQTATSLVNRAVSGGRNKLIIDVSKNPGGSIARAFDLFKLFFPSKFPYSATRFRRHPGADILVLSNQKANATVAGPDPFTFQAAVDPAQDEAFASIDDFLNGEIQLGVNVTSLYANFNYTLYSVTNPETGTIRGFGGAPINNTQPFAPEDILIVTDGMCSSTCTTFVNLMTNVGGVRALTFGGRPRSEPMQAMGGVRGAQSFEWSSIDQEVINAAKNVKMDPSLLTKAQVALGDSALPIGTSNLPLISSGGVNLRNAYQEGDDNLPLQFQYQASDCRLFYTAKNILEPASTWADAKAAVWGNSGCVANSTGGKGSLEDRTKSNSSNKDDSNGGGNANGDNSSNNGTNTDDDSAAGNLQLGGSLFSLCIFISVGIILI